MKKCPLLVLLGPTAVGKTALSLALARALGAEIISGDSMLVYRGFDIGTAKPTAAERAAAVHHLIDIRGPEARYSVQDFQQDATRLAGEIAARGHLPFVVGGTGLYVQSLVEGYAFSEAGGDAAYRAELMQLAEKKGRSAVYALLQKADPVAAAGIHPHNLHRVVRALEARHTGRGISFLKKEPPFHAYVIGLARPRAELYARIDARVDAMFAAGLAAEVRGLLVAGIPPTAQAMQGIGYKETAAYLRGEMSEAEAVRAIKLATRHFAKRQLTWYRRMNYIHWFDVSGRKAEDVCAEILWNLRHEKGFFPFGGE